MRWAGSTKSKVPIVLEVSSNNTYLFSIRSSSVIFVPAESSYGGIPSMSGAKDLANPYLGGFGFSRPETASPLAYYERGSAARSHITLDCYHHPSKRWNPSLRYIQAFDLYSYVQYPFTSIVVLTELYALVLARSSSKSVCGNRLIPSRSTTRVLCSSSVSS